jgi:hypothetical protein
MDVSILQHLYGEGIHTYHSRFIPEGAAETCQIFFRDAHVLPKLLSYDEFPRRVVVRQAAGRKIIAESLSHDEKHVEPTPLSVGKGRNKTLL